MNTNTDNNTNNTTTEEQEDRLQLMVEYEDKYGVIEHKDLSLCHKLRLMIDNEDWGGIRQAIIMMIISKNSFKLIGKIVPAL